MKVAIWITGGGTPIIRDLVIKEGINHRGTLSDFIWYSDLESAGIQDGDTCTQ